MTKGLMSTITAYSKSSATKPSDMIRIHDKDSNSARYKLSVILSGVAMAKHGVVENPPPDIEKATFEKREDLGNDFLDAEEGDF